MKYQLPCELGFTQHGFMIYTPTDKYVGKSLQKYGWYSPTEFHILPRLMHRNAVAFDIGANIGVITLELAKYTSRVYAFEPQPILAYMLKANIGMNCPYNAEGLAMALSDVDGIVQIPIFDYAKEGHYAGISDAHWGKGQDVTMCKLDTFMNERGISQCDFIKCDVEGMECKVLKGASNTIAKHRPTMLVENDKPDKSKELIGYIKSLNYNVYWLRTLIYSEDNPFGDKENIYVNEAMMNMICVPQEKSELLKLEGFPEVGIDDDVLNCPPNHLCYIRYNTIDAEVDNNASV